MPHIIQYDMGLRLWVLSGPAGQILQTYFSRTAALKDHVVRRIIDGGGELRIRNADGTFAMPDSTRRTTGLSQTTSPNASASAGASAAPEPATLLWA